MAQMVRALAVLSEDPGSFSSTPNGSSQLSCYSSFRKSDTFSAHQITLNKLFSKKESCIVSCLLLHLCPAGLSCCLLESDLLGGEWFLHTAYPHGLTIFLGWGCIRWLISQEHASQQVESELGVITVSAPVWAPVRKSAFHQTGSLITSLSEMMSRGKRACQVCIRLTSTARQYP